jgi:hypothetical protein
VIAVAGPVQPTAAAGRALLATLALALLGGCPGTRHRSDVNAPGIVHLEAPPPRENGDPQRFLEPEDPGEQEVYLGPAIILGPASGRSYDSNHTEFETSIQLRVAYRTLAKSHRSEDVPFPMKGWALTVGWSPLQTDHAPSDDVTFHTGPVYAEVERFWYIASAGLGLVSYPDNWDTGVQATLNFMPYGIRMRYLAEGGFEVMAAFRLELPTAINWSR